MYSVQRFKLNYIDLIKSNSVKYSVYIYYIVLRYSILCYIYHVQNH